jgi:plasmid stabilization system protein ParE
MGYQVIFAPEAERDLNEIIAYIAQANPEAALKFGAELAAQAKPAAWPNCRTGVRSWLGGQVPASSFTANTSSTTRSEKRSARLRYCGFGTVPAADRSFKRARRGAVRLNRRHWFER